MNNIVRILELVLFTSLYSLVVGNTHLISSGSCFTKQPYTDQHSYFSAASNELVCQATEITNSICTFNNTTPPLAKEFSAVLTIREQIFACVISQYISSSTHLLVRFRKMNLLFPFHYFL